MGGFVGGKLFDIYGNYDWSFTFASMMGVINLIILCAFYLRIRTSRQLQRKRCVNRGVPYPASAGIFFTDHGRRFSISSTVSACGSAVNTWRRY